MLYTFKSKATGNLIMLQASGEQLLEIIGKGPSPKGIVLPEQIPAAIAALEAALAKDDSRRHAAGEAARAKGEDAPRQEGISLRQRAVPFIEMLRRCHKAGEEIVWGV